MGRAIQAISVKIITFCSVIYNLYFFRKGAATPNLVPKVRIELTIINHVKIDGPPGRVSGK